MVLDGKRRPAGLLVSVALLLTACSAPAQGTPDAAVARGVDAAPAAVAGGPGGPAGLIGGKVTVLGTWGGSEQESFLAMVRPFEERTGITVEYQGTRDLNAILTTRLQGGNPPDVSGLPGPGQMAEYARAGRLVDLSTVLDEGAMAQEYGEDWLRLGSADGRHVGVFVKAALKGSVWYNVRDFPRYAPGGPPRTWDELAAVAGRARDAGVTPWCIGLGAGAASGWPGTDWIEDIVLRQAGPDAYDRWTRGELAWTSPELRRAWQTWGGIVGDERLVFGGRQSMLAVNFGEAGNPMFMNPPRCVLHHQGSFITDFFVKSNPSLKPVDDFDFFPFPDIDPAYAGSVIAAGDLFGMFNDTPQARALMQYVTTPEAQAIWVRRGGAISPNRRVPLDAYPDPIARKQAESLTTARTVRFDGSDLMPEALNNAFWTAVLDFVQRPDRLDAVLDNLDKTQRYVQSRS